MGPSQKKLTRNILNLIQTDDTSFKIYGVRPTYKQMMANRKLVLKTVYARTKPKTKKQIKREKRSEKFYKLKIKSKPRRFQIYKKANYKSRRYIGYFFRYARNYLRNRRFFLKNIMVIKRFTAYGSGFLRKRQFRSIVNKVNAKIVRPTDARMYYFLTFSGIINNALFRLHFAHPSVFKFIDQLICHGNIMINERLARFPNMFVLPGDKIEVVHNFWVKYTRKYVARFSYNRGNPRRLERFKRRQRNNFFKRRSSIPYHRRRSMRRRRIRQFIYSKRQKQNKTINYYTRLVRRSRRKLRLLRSPSKRKAFLRDAHAKRMVKRFVLPEDYDYSKVYPVNSRARHFKRDLSKLARFYYCRLLQVKSAYAIKLTLLTQIGKRPKRRVFKKLTRALYFRFFKHFRQIPARYVRRRTNKWKRSFKKYFKKLRSRHVRSIPPFWQVCIYARTAYMIKPISYNSLSDPRFKKRFLNNLFKFYNKFRY